MADDIPQVRITELPAATRTNDDDQYEVSQAGVPGSPATSRRMSHAMLKAGVKPDLTSYLTGLIPGDGIVIAGSAPILAVSMETLNKAGTWGDAQNVPEVTVDIHGRVTNVDLIPLPQIDLSPYALLDSPAFKNNPTAPLQPGGTNNATLASAAFVQQEIAARGFLTDAPSDGNTYGRKNGAWAEAAGGAGDDSGYTFNASVATPPASGEARLNNAGQTTATAIYLSGTSAAGANAYNILMLSMKAGVKVLLQDRTDTTRWLIFRATADAIGHATWVELPVVLDTASGVLLNPGSRIVTYTAAPTGGSVWVSEAAPASPLPNMLWWQSALGMLFLYYDDGNTKQWVPASPAPVGQTVPPGSVMDYAGANAPAGWLFCQGQLLSRTLYPALFTAIGTRYGVGDGSTTFGLPDTGGRVTVGKEAVATRLTVAISGVDGGTLGAVGGDQNMPAHIHYGLTGNSGATNTGRFGYGDGNNMVNVPTTSAGAGASQNVQPSIVMNKIIKT